VQIEASCDAPDFADLVLTRDGKRVFQSDFSLNTKIVMLALRGFLDYGDTFSMDLRASGILLGKTRLEATVS
jgi:hypothetical protein